MAYNVGNTFSVSIETTRGGRLRARVKEGRSQLLIVIIGGDRWWNVNPELRRTIIEVARVYLAEATAHLDEVSRKDEERLKHAHRSARIA